MFCRRSKASNQPIHMEGNIPATVQADQRTIGVVLDLTDWAVAVDLLVQSLGDVLHQCTQRTVQDQVAITCKGAPFMQITHATERATIQACYGRHAIQDLVACKRWKAKKSRSREGKKERHMGQ